MNPQVIRYGQKEPLVLRGKNFHESELVLKIDGIKTPYAKEVDKLVVSKLPKALTAGVKVVRLYNEVLLSGRKPHLVEADETTFLFTPVIKGVAQFALSNIPSYSRKNVSKHDLSTEVQCIDTIQIDVKPRVDSQQSIILWLNPYDEKGKKGKSDKKDVTMRRGYGITSLLRFPLNKSISEELVKVSSSVGKKLCLMFRDVFHEKSIELSGDLSIKVHKDKKTWVLTDTHLSQHYVIRSDKGELYLYYGLAGEVEHLWHRLAFAVSLDRGDDVFDMNVPYVASGKYLVRLQVGENSQCESPLIKQHVSKKAKKTKAVPLFYTHPVISIPVTSK